MAVTNTVYIEKLNESRIKVHAERDILKSLASQLEFYAENYKYNPKFKQGIWDGRIRLLSSYDGTAPSGLWSKVSDLLDEMEIEHEIDESLLPDETVTRDLAIEIAKDSGCVLTPREYQINTVYEAIRNKRALILSPTASGKSFSIYLLAKYFQLRDENVLLIVNRKALASQIKTDFDEYEGKNFDAHLIIGGVEKNSNKNVVISTWQSIYKMDSSFFDRYSAIIVDEAHGAKSKSIIDLMNKAPTIEYRFGLTGTTDDVELNELTLMGLFGKKFQVAETHQLIKDGVLADLTIKIVKIGYDEASCKAVAKMRNFSDQNTFLKLNNQRNDLIAGLAASQKGNVLLLVEHIDHLKKLHDNVTSRTNRNVYVIHGSVDLKERERIRMQMEKEDNAILIATFGSFSVGSNIKRLDKVILGVSFKSKVRILQSIGRSLRKGNGSNSAVVYDIVDDLTYDGKPNFGMIHANKRIEHYVKEKFKWKLMNVSLKTS